MQNPFSSRRDDDFRREDDRPGRRGREQRHDEARSWTGGADERWDSWRQQDRQEDSPPAYRTHRDDWRSDYRAGEGGGYGRRDWASGRDSDTAWGYYDAQRSDSPRYGEDYRHGERSRYGRSGHEGYRRDPYRNEGAYGRSSTQDRPQHAYAPGSQIWDQGGRRAGNEDFEPDYLHWRDQQLSRFDQDYADWRNEKRQKFSSDFDSWRQTRPKKTEHHLTGENPIVGDVADGGVGDVDVRKKS